MIEQELGNLVPFEDHIVTILTQILVDPDDRAFEKPSKPVGPIYDREQADILQREKGWAMAPDGEYYRRVVPSPEPQWIIEMNVIRMLVDSGITVICAGGGGIPVAYDEHSKLFGVEAVIDKDLASGLLATGLDADMFVMLTDVSHVYEGYGTSRQRAIRAAHPDALKASDFASGSMGPKVRGACKFVRETGKTSAIGQLSELVNIIDGKAGTLISNQIEGIHYV
jgi:carbamate kinase